MALHSPLMDCGSVVEKHCHKELSVYTFFFINSLSLFQLEIWGNVQVWRQAFTQVFFALGLGFGSIIAYSSYNQRNNNCHRDAITVSIINFLTSVLASLVVFSVLGFRAKTFAKTCISEYVHTHTTLPHPTPHPE